jgi:hypothetical protein
MPSLKSAKGSEHSVSEHFHSRDEKNPARFVCVALRKSSLWEPIRDFSKLTGYLEVVLPFSGQVLLAFIGRELRIPMMNFSGAIRGH